jgi:hypothetical protein
MTKRIPRTSPPGIRLSSLAEIRTELATIYRLARRHPEQMAWSEATKAAHVLMSLARLTADCQALEVARRQSEAAAAFNREEDERQANDPLYQDLRRIAGLPPLPTGRNGSGT